jgi:UrcA family protein
MNFRNICPQSTFLATLVTTLATAGLAFGATPSRAADLDPAFGPRSQVVVYDDLNLANPKGAESLYDRIASAAKTVCDSRNSRSLTSLAYHRACVAETIDRAVNAVGSPQLTAVYQARMGRTETVALAQH